MTDQEQFAPVPPRTVTLAQQPQPQTVFGILNDSGFPSDIRNISDLPPDFGWMSAIEEYVSNFPVKSSYVGDLTTIYPYDKYQDQHDPGNARGELSWHWIPFSCSRWWTGCVRLRFIAIKAPRVPCKILFTYVPDLIGEGAEPKKRLPKIEWDVGMHNNFVLDLIPANITGPRPTWITWTKPKHLEYDNKQFYTTTHLAPHRSMICPGKLKVETASASVPGGIFPDTFHVLVFQSFPDAQFYQRTDPRSSKDHIFAFSSTAELPPSQPAPTSVGYGSIRT